MKFRLRTYEVNPPGGYPFSQYGVNFPSQPMIEAQAQIVANYRKANGKDRATVREALEDIDSHTCQRLGNMPAYCCPADASQVVVALGPTSPTIAPPCRGCGAPMTV